VELALGDEAVAVRVRVLGLVLRAQVLREGLEAVAPAADALADGALPVAAGLGDVAERVVAEELRVREAAVAWAAKG
jgi:hypothetical protein